MKGKKKTQVNNKGRKRSVWKVKLEKMSSTESKDYHKKI